MADFKRSELTVNSETKNVEMIFAEVEKLLVGSPVSREWISDILICVDEAFSNIIRHGYGNCPEGEIRLTMTLEGDSFCITFWDDAAAYTPPQEKPTLGRAILERKTPGLGWYLMQQLMDKVVYQRMGASNCLALTKNIRSEDHHETDVKRVG
jgi:serine/threonine-protein kinase RsbW